MSRSLKKGPYVDAKLLNVIQKMNRGNEKRSLKPMFGGVLFIPKWWDIPLRFIMEKNLFQFSLQKIWLATNWANSPQPVLLKAMDR